MMTRHVFTSILVVFVFLSPLYSQHFEGKVIYQNAFKSKMPNLTDAQLTDMMGTKQDFFIKNGNYRSVSNGNFFQWQIYIHKDNKLYSKLAGSPTVLWNDGAENNDEVVKVELNEHAVIVLGNSCDELVITSRKGVQKFYFNRNMLKIDAKLFTRHKFQHWDVYMEKANVVPLKLVIDNDQFSMEGVAVEIVPMKLDDKQFDLPADITLQKSPF